MFRLFHPLLIGPTNNTWRTIKFVKPFVIFLDVADIFGILDPNILLSVSLSIIESPASVDITCGTRPSIFHSVCLKLLLLVRRPQFSLFDPFPLLCHHPLAGLGTTERTMALLY